MTIIVYSIICFGAIERFVPSVVYCTRQTWSPYQSFYKIDVYTKVPGRINDLFLIVIVSQCQYRMILVSEIPVPSAVFIIKGFFGGIGTDFSHTQDICRRSISFFDRLSNRNISTKFQPFIDLASQSQFGIQTRIVAFSNRILFSSTSHREIIGSFVISTIKAQVNITLRSAVRNHIIQPIHLLLTHIKRIHLSPPRGNFLLQSSLFSCRKASGRQLRSNVGYTVFTSFTKYHLVFLRIQHTIVERRGSPTVISG